MAIEKIETIEVGSGGAASIEFTSIPQDGVDLLLVTNLRSTTTSGVGSITFNSSTTGYSFRNLAGNGASAFSQGYGESRVRVQMVPSSYTASTFSNEATLISNYTSSQNKSVSSDGVRENNATDTQIAIIATTWANTDAITSLQITAPLAQYSTASLYKIS